MTDLLNFGGNYVNFCIQVNQMIIQFHRSFVEDTIISNDTDKAETFNSYFSSVSVVEDPDTYINDVLPQLRTQLDSLFISNQDVIDVILNLKDGKACGIDLINHKLLKESLSVLSLSLSRIFNRSLSLGKFPNKWKLANLTPIFKSQEPHFVNNYRPISLLSCLGKVFERCVFKYVFNYFRTHQLISLDQSGFIPGDSTVNQLVSIYHNTCTSLDDHNDVQMVFFDISKAFDKAWHKA